MLGPTPLREGTFVAVDIETTGGRPGASDIIEIGAVRISDGRLTDTFTTLVRPKDRVPAVISELTGIRDVDLSDAPGVDDAIARFADFAADAVLVAHNHRFDLGFLDYEAERILGAPFPRPVLDTLSLARRLQPGLTHYNLRELALRYGAMAVPNHRALPDATATAEVFLAMVEAMIERGLITAADAASFCGLARQGGLSRKLALATYLPDGPGLYLFRDPDGAVVFVGRAKELRSRVRSHFYAPTDADGRTHAALTHSIDHIACSSRLDALLLESRLLDRYRPHFNRNRYPLRSPLYLHIDPTADVPVFRVTRRRYRTGVLFGPLSNEWAASTLAASLSSHFRLRRCTRSATECLARDCRYRTGGACPGAEASADARTYQDRVDDALAIFSGSSDAFRQTLDARREAAAAAEAYEEAIRHRDASRALDRTLAALASAARATREAALAIIEGDEHGIAVHVVVQGWLHTTLRFNRDEIASESYLEPLGRAVSRARTRAARSLPVTPRRLRDMLIIDAYRQEQAPLIVPVTEDLEAAVRQMSTVIRRTMRIPRKRHGVVSAD